LRLLFFRNSCRESRAILKSLFLLASESKEVICFIVVYKRNINLLIKTIIYAWNLKNFKNIVC